MDRTVSISSFPELTIFDKPASFHTSLELIENRDNICTYKFEIQADLAASPEPITLRWKLPSLNVKGIWKSGSLHNKRQQYDWELEHLQARISVDAPVIGVFGHDDKNVISFACSDAINLLEMNALLREEDQHLYCHITFFRERHPEIKHYATEIRVDMREVVYSKALEDMASWWEKFDAYTPAAVPDLARAPMYSTWYNFHQDLDEDILLEECAIAQELGYELLLVDDGWQTYDTNRGYDYTGDWQPDRFPDMAGFAEKVHKLGMKFGIWYSVPFCGKYSQAYQKFKGKFLTENHRWAPVFDPRYPEVRQHLIDIYVNALKDWKLDAFKLDFIDDFKVYPETVLSKENGRDYANVNAAVDRLLTDVSDALREIKPDIAIEFRQKYIGPAMRKFGNMFRAFDCPIDPVSNRIRITDVKFLCGNSAVHSDMIIWHPEETVENASLQVLNAFFGVPQMSVHLRDLPPAHMNMVRFYTQYWKEHAPILLDGTFRAANPLGNYPLLSASLEGHIIKGVYDELRVEIGEEHTHDLLNGKLSPSIIIKNAGPACIYSLKTWNCQGEVEATRQIELSAKGLYEISVSPGGLARLERI